MCYKYARLKHQWRCLLQACNNQTDLAALPIPGTQWRSWLRHCATSQVMGSIPEGVVGLLHWLNRSSCTMAQEYFLGSKCSQCAGLTTLPPSCTKCLQIWEPQPPGTLKACTGIALPFTLCSSVVPYKLLLHILLKTNSKHTSTETNLQ
jgi:hypothetical protein